MTNETQIWSLYLITNKINNKVYVGQAADVSKRWHDHRRAFSLNKPTQVIHHAIIKYGLDNFEFQIIACCKTQDDANSIETLLVAQYDSFISNGKGYNVTYGGNNAPKSKEWKQAMRDWHASLSPEERAIISQKQSESFTKYIRENGHIAQGTKRTPEQIQNLVRARAEHPVEYTPELRQKMSESHIGKTDSEETKKKKSISIKVALDKRTQLLIESGELKCNAPGCDKKGQIDYRIIDNVRYCMAHGLRFIRHGSFDRLPQPNKGIPMPEELRAQCGIANIGKVPHNKIKFTEDQISLILTDPRPSRAIAKDFNVSQNTILRLKFKNTAK